ncbi:MAG: hypothetical protein AB8G26_07220 [Ilumatobacter sp.]
MAIRQRKWGSRPAFPCRRALGAAVLVAGLAACSITSVDPAVRAVRADAAVVASVPTPIEPSAPSGSDPDPDPDDLGPGESEQSPSTTETANDEASRDPVSSPPSTIPEPLPPSDEETAQIVDELIAAGFCDAQDFDDDGEVTAIHFVLDGVIQNPCFVAQPGDVDDVVFDDDPRLIAAWNELLRVTPVGLVDDISLLAGYESCSTCDTLAYVTTLDVDAEFFVIAVDVVAAAENLDELRLTMLHELAHVFTQRPGDQLLVQDVDVPCPTYFNGIGCFTETSYMWAWIEAFWPADVLDTLPDDGSVATDAEAEARCNLDPAFTGSYAAVHPEEDFAETFSAFVFDVEVDSALASKLEFFERYPEFVEVRENARAEGLAGTEAAFEGCG